MPIKRMPANPLCARCRDLADGFGGFMLDGGIVACKEHQALLNKTASNNKDNKAALLKKIVINFFGTFGQR